MYRNQTIAQATLTDTGVVISNPVHKIESEFEGVVTFNVLANTVTGTLDGDCQLQGSIDGTNWTNIGSTVAIADAATITVPLGGTVLYYSYYRITTTGVGTQSTTLDVQYLARGRG
ncbi:MAG: hypothetical protein GY951_03495 [Psychromonas sp.]|nr:hypothetical protein [Psychromonas sp.]